MDQLSISPPADFTQTQAYVQSQTRRPQYKLRGSLDYSQYRRILNAGIHLSGYSIAADAWFRASRPLLKRFFVFTADDALEPLRFGYLHSIRPSDGVVTYFCSVDKVLKQLPKDQQFKMHLFDGRVHGKLQPRYHGDTTRLLASLYCKLERKCRKQDLSYYPQPAERLLSQFSKLNSRGNPKIPKTAAFNWLFTECVLENRDFEIDAIDDLSLID